MSKMKLVATVSLLVASTAMLAGTALGNPHVLGTSSAKVASRASTNAATRPLTIKPYVTFTNASYATGGVALRNRSQGVIHISGVSGKVRKAYLYFTYLFSATPPPLLPITLTRLFPGPSSSRVLSAKLIATSADPCWGSSGGAIYEVAVPVALAKGNGEYQVQPDASVVGLNTGEDPWDGNPVYPMDEGASLVLISDGPYTVDLFSNNGLAGQEFDTPFNYRLVLSSAAGPTVLMDSIGADGQLGASRNGYAAGDAVSVNGTVISGTGSAAGVGSDWDGSSGFPLPQLWDDVGHDISSAAAGAVHLDVAITPSSGGDCLITVANVVAH